LPAGPGSGRAGAQVRAAGDGARRDRDGATPVIVLETLVTTVDASGKPHCAPMGIVPEGEAAILLRPFRTAATCANLQATGEGVVNFTDDVLLFARAALSPFVPPGRPAARVRASILQAACSWREFRVVASDVSGERAS